MWVRKFEESVLGRTRSCSTSLRDDIIDIALNSVKPFSVCAATRSLPSRKFFKGSLYICINDNFVSSNSSAMMGVKHVSTCCVPKLVSLSIPSSYVHFSGHVLFLWAILRRKWNDWSSRFFYPRWFAFTETITRSSSIFWSGRIFSMNTVEGDNMSKNIRYLDVTVNLRLTCQKSKKSSNFACKGYSSKYSDQITSSG